MQSEPIDTMPNPCRESLSQMHHDMANYLNAVRGYAELACNHLTGDSTARNYLDRQLQAVGAAMALLQRVGQVLSASPLPDPGPLDLGDLVRRGIEVAVPSLAANVRISMHVHQRPAAVAGDGLALQRLITNVALNAGQAMPLGGALQVVVESHQIVDGLQARNCFLGPGRYFRVTVRDSGFGMADATLARIFEPGFTTRSDGSGLGLSSALETLKRHRGGIIVNSWLGTGTEVHLYLPCADSG